MDWVLTVTSSLMCTVVCRSISTPGNGIWQGNALMIL